MAFVRIQPVSFGTGVFAALSDEDGATWKHLRKREGVSGCMAMTQSPDGMVRVVGTRKSAVSFNEAWLQEGQPLKKEASR